MSIEAMKQALEWIDAQPEPRMIRAGVICAALHQAIEQAEQIEPEDWRHYRHFHEQAEKQEPVAKHVCNLWVDPQTLEYEVDRCTHPINEVIPVYTAPPRKEWVGLNWDDIPEVFVGDIAFMQGAKWALAKLKEKNT